MSWNAEKSPIWQDTMHCLPQRLKKRHFLKKFWVKDSRRRSGVKKKLQKMLTSVFEVIVPPPKHTFEIGVFFCILAHCTYNVLHIVVLLLTRLINDDGIKMFCMKNWNSYKGSWPFSFYITHNFIMYFPYILTSQRRK